MTSPGTTLTRGQWQHHCYFGLHQRRSHCATTTAPRVSSARFARRRADYFANREIKTMTKKECLDKMNAQIEDWKCEMKALEDKAADAGEEVKAKCQEAMDALRCQCQEGEAKLEEWKAKAEDAWEDFQDEAEDALTSLKTSMSDSIQRIKAFFA
jgi:chromosome segregation ATPase